MAGWFDRFMFSLQLEGSTQICVARGRVSWGSEDNDAAGALQLRYREGVNVYYLYTRKIAGDDMLVCKLLLFTSKSALTKSKRY